MRLFFLTTALALALAGCGHVEPTHTLPFSPDAALADLPSVQVPRVEALLVNGQAGRNFQVPRNRPLVVTAREANAEGATRDWTLNGNHLNSHGATLTLDGPPTTFAVIIYRLGRPHVTADSATIYLRAV